MFEIHRGEHHGKPLNFSQLRILKPTAEEERDTVLAVHVVTGWCQDPDCRKRFIFSACEYVGGLGPSHRHRDPQVIKNLLRRLSEARESDWVWGHDPETYAKKKVMVR